VIIFVSVAKNLHEFWTRGPEFRSDGQLRRICGSKAEYRFFLSYVRPWLVLVVVMAVPFLLILAFNCLIVNGLVKAQQARSRTASVPTCSTPAADTGRRRSSAGTAFRQTTLMCLAISFAFLVCIAPSIVLLIGKPYWKHRTNVMYRNAKAISNFLVFVNHSINFFLYCVAGQHFRRQLGAMFCRCRRRVVVDRRL